MPVSQTDRIEKRIELNAAPARVWRALTDHREFGEWFRVRLASPFVVGQRTRGHVTHPGYEHLTMDVQVTVMEAGRRFAFTWHPYAIDPGIDYSAETPTTVEFTLQPTAARTLLTVTESGFDALPAGRRDEAFRMNGNGWEAQMSNVAAHLGGAS